MILFFLILQSVLASEIYAQMMYPDGRRVGETSAISVMPYRNTNLLDAYTNGFNSPEYSWSNTPRIEVNNSLTMFNLEPFSSSVSRDTYLGIDFTTDFWESPYPSLFNSDLDFGWEFDPFRFDDPTLLSLSPSDAADDLFNEFRGDFLSCFEEKFNTCTRMRRMELRTRFTDSDLRYAHSSIRKNVRDDALDNCRTQSERQCVQESFDKINEDVDNQAFDTRQFFSNLMEPYRALLGEDSLLVRGVVKISGNTNEPCPATPQDQYKVLYDELLDLIETTPKENTKTNCNDLKRLGMLAANAEDEEMITATTGKYCECMERNLAFPVPSLEIPQDERYSGLSCEETKEGMKHFVAKEMSEITSNALNLKNIALLTALKNPSILSPNEPTNIFRSCVPSSSGKLQIPDEICPEATANQLKLTLFQMMEQALPASSNGENLLAQLNIENIDDFNDVNAKNMIIQNMAVLRPDLLDENYRNFHQKTQSERIALLDQFDMDEFYARLANSPGENVLQFTDEDADLLHNMEVVIANYNDPEEGFNDWFNNLNNQQRQVFQKLNALRHIADSETGIRNNLVFGGRADSAWELAKFYRGEVRHIRNGLRRDMTAGLTEIEQRRDPNMRDSSHFILSAENLNSAMNNGDMLNPETLEKSCTEFFERVVNLCQAMSANVPVLPKSEYEMQSPDLEEAREDYLSHMELGEDPYNKFDQLMCYSRIRDEYTGEERGTIPRQPIPDMFIHGALNSCEVNPAEMFSANSLKQDFFDEIGNSDRKEWEERCRSAADSMGGEEGQIQGEHLDMTNAEVLAKMSDEDRARFTEEELSKVNGYDVYCKESKPPAIGAVLANSLEAILQTDDFSERASEASAGLIAGNVTGGSLGGDTLFDPMSNLLYSEFSGASTARSNGLINSGSISNDGGSIVSNVAGNGGELTDAQRLGSRDPASVERNMVREEAEIARNAGFDSGNNGSSGFGSNDDIISRVASEAASRSSGNSFNVEQFRESASNALENIDAQINDVERRKAVAEAAGSSPENDPAYAALLAELEALKKDQSTLKDMLGNEKKLRAIAEAEAREVEERRSSGANELEGSGSGQSQRIAGSNIAAGGGSQVNAGPAAGGFGGGGVSGGSGGGGSVSGGGAISGNNDVDYSGGTFTGNTINTNSIGTITLSASESAPVFSAGVQSDQNTNFWSEMIKTSPNNYVLIQTETEGIYYRKSMKGDQVVTELVKVDEDTKEIIVINGTQKIDGREIASEKDVNVDAEGSGPASGPSNRQNVFKSKLDKLIESAKQ